ncbi:MAG: mechanosensitive ion channel [Rhodospirillales bacterium]|nr:mechanosensitive ion channel [Rhodospirillales bacterium]MDE0378192.1 mechanosensitive ion channel [Rhodospirillales bacterium]
MAAALWHAFRPGVQRPRLGPSCARFARVAALFLTALWLAASVPALAQESAPGSGAADAQALENLVETLESPENRERFLADLKAALEARQAQEESEDAEGASAMRAISDGVAVLGRHIVELAREIAGIPDAIAWLIEHWGEPDERDAWLIAFGKLVAVIAAGIAGGLIAFYALTRLRRRVERREAPSPWLRPPLLLYHAVLRAAPNLIAAGVAYGVLTVISPAEAARVIALAIINAHLIVSVVKAAGTLVLAPYAPQLRLAPITDENAAYCSVWWRRLVNIGAYGYVFCQAALLLGLPESGFEALIRLLGILLVGLLITFILQNRIAFARWLHETGQASGTRAHLRVFAFLGKLADFWHIPAILYVVAGGLLAAAEGLDGFLFLIKGSAATIAIAWATGFGFAGVRRAFERGFRVRAELHERYPGLQARVNRYLPVARRAAQAVILLLGICLILEAWNADIFTWLASETGRAVIATLASIVAIALIATIVLEVASTLVDRYLTQADEAGELLERSQRARTLLPLARNALRVVVGIIAALMILSEIGIDIAPVLAGVGVAGLAIGFGAQTLVKDIITGLFILLEDSVAVGDVVTAGGHTGTVEAITIRTIRMRDLQGQVHTVPYSSVDTISNMTKEFSYYLIDMGVAYREDYDEVVAVMREVGAALQQDPEYGPNMLEPLEIMGLNSFGDSAVIVRARLKTKPLTQWATGREYNRRLKAAFDDRGIEIPFPHTQIYFGEDKQGRVPAARVVIEDARADADTPASPPVSPGAGQEREQRARQPARTPRERTADGPEDAGSSSGDDAPG